MGRRQTIRMGSMSLPNPYSSANRVCARPRVKVPGTNSDSEVADVEAAALRRSSAECPAITSACSGEVGDGASETDICSSVCTVRGPVSPPLSPGMDGIRPGGSRSKVQGDPRSWQWTHWRSPSLARTQRVFLLRHASQGRPLRLGRFRVPDW